MFFSPSAILAFFFSLFMLGQVAASPLPMVAPVERRAVAVQEASKSDGGDVVPYKRRQVSVEEASKSDGGDVVPYKRRQVSVEEASKSDGGDVVPYKRYSDIPLEVAVRSVDGVVELY